MAGTPSGSPSRRGIRRRRRRRPCRRTRRRRAPRRACASIAGVVTPGASPLRFSHSSAICGPLRASRRARARAHGAGDVANPFEASLHLAVAVDVPLGHFPVVDARISDRAGVGQHEASFELARRRPAAPRVARRRRRAPPRRRRRRAPAGSPGRRSARRSPAPRRSSRSASCRRRCAVVRSRRPARRTRRCSAPTIRRCRHRPEIPSACAVRGLGLKVLEQPAEQSQFVVVVELAPVRDLDAPLGVARDDRRAPVAARPDRAARPKADGGVDASARARGTDRAARCRGCRRPDRSALARRTRCAPEIIGIERRHSGLLTAAGTPSRC